MSEEQFTKSNASLEDSERPNKKIKFDESDDNLSTEKVTEDEEDKLNENIEEVVSEDEKAEHKKEKKSKKDKSS